MVGVTQPAIETIQALIAACGCSRERAMTLLQDNHDNVEAAKSQYAILKRYFGDTEPARSRAGTPDASSPYRAPSKYELYSPDGSSDEEETSEPEFPEVPSPGTSRGASDHNHTTNVEARSKTLADSSRFGSRSALSFEVDDAAHTAKITQDNDSSSVDPASKIRAEKAAEHGCTSVMAQQAWDFELPTLEIFTNLDGGGTNLDECSGPFDASAFASAIQHGASTQSLLSYLDQYSDPVISRHIKEEVDGFPLMFYVVQSNDERLLRYVVARGGDPAAVHRASGIPLLAYAIVNSRSATGDKTLIVATLLSLGVPAHVIPPAFYSPYLKDLPESGPEKSGGSKDEDNAFTAAWCTEDVVRILSATMTLSHRYYLEKAATLRKPTPREIDLAQRRNAEGLLGIPYFLIGQSLASHLLLRKLLSHILSPSKRPLVMVFAGPSGHGKTELARRLGHLLSLELEVVDCTAVSREIELFGPREPYSGAEKGSPLNNFLAKHSGQRCIVFLDEFEKTTTDIHKTLLLPFDNGEYQDRRHRTNVNCSNTIWILATNAHDAIIQDFFEANEEGLLQSEDKEEHVRLTKKLSTEIKVDFMSRFGPPLTGRISAFIPFLPFSLGEQAVIIHKYLMDLGESVEGAVNLSRGPKEKLLGNVQLKIHKDASVCQILAQSGYNTHLGARSLISAVDTVKSRLVDEYLEINDGFSEDPQKTECLVDVRGGEIVVKMTAPK